LLTQQAMIPFPGNISIIWAESFDISALISRFWNNIERWIEQVLPWVIAHRTGMIWDKKETARIEGSFRYEISQIYRIITSKDFEIERLSDISTPLTRWQDVLFTPKEIIQLQALINKGNKIIDTEYQITEKHKNSVKKALDSFEQDTLSFTRPIRSVLRNIQYKTSYLLENMHY